MPDEVFNLVIVTPETTVYEGQVAKLIAPGIYQDIAILPNHTPLYAQLIKGQIRLTDSTGQVETFTIDGGIIRVKHNHVSVIVGFHGHSP
ncbi:hypothetical protein A2W24_02280 [Microgenomates group bacterium RBG_16_45_19]|nr:MAG: hypothetical protein A2W24_02280 [Microgenomates group bacterium RBG_16_45_19]